MHAELDPHIINYWDGLINAEELEMVGKFFTYWINQQVGLKKFALHSEGVGFHHE